MNPQIFYEMEKNIKKALKYSKKIILNSRCKDLPFHNLEHTLEVYKNLIKIGTYENIGYEELEPIIIAGLFHDTGNAFRFDGHEDVSATYAILYMEKNGYDEDFIEKVCGFIKATKIPQNPRNIYESIICDADLHHLGTESYQTKNKLLRREWQNFLGFEYSDEEWLILNIKFLQNHRFHSQYGRLKLEPQKQINLDELRRQYESLCRS